MMHTIDTSRPGLRCLSEDSTSKAMIDENDWTFLLLLRNQFAAGYARYPQIKLPPKSPGHQEGAEEGQ